MSSALPDSGALRISRCIRVCIEGGRGFFQRGDLEGSMVGWISVSHALVLAGVR